MPTSLRFAAAALALPALASAQSSWTSNAPGDWLDPMNWSAGVPNAVGAEAIIIGAPEGGPVDTVGTFTAASPVTLGSLSVDMGFAGPSVFFNMPQLIFDNAGGADVFVSTDGSLACEIFSDVVLMGDLISNWRAGNGRISGSISGDYGITHDPDFESNFELAGANTYTGETRILNGRLRIKLPEALGSPASGTFVTGSTSSLIVDFEGSGALELVTLESGGRIWLRNATITSDIVISGSGGITPWFDNSTATLSGVISGDQLVKSTAQSNLTNDPTAEAALFLSGESNTYTGGTVINAGLLVAAADGSLGAAGTPITFEEPFGFSEGPPAFGTRFDAAIARPISLVDDGWLRAYEGTTATYTQPITESVFSGLTINAPGGPGAAAFPDWTGTVVLTADNDYSGGTDVRLGTLVADNILGSATGSGAVVIQENASLSGGGIIQGPVDMTAGGSIHPGSPVGSIILGGGITFGASSVSTFELTGRNNGQFDKIIAGNPSTLDGEIVVMVDPGFTPSDGDEFELVQASGGYTGAFATENLPTGFSLRYEPNGVILEFAGVSCPADLSADGFVAADDLASLIAAWGQTGTPADLDGGGVGASDLAALIAAWGPCS
jgi:autotransporter-associated beta strand protein